MSRLMQELEQWALMQDRVLRVLGRHFRIEDMQLSDADFVSKIYERFEKERREPIIDVNE